MTTLQKIGVGVVVILALLGGLAFFKSGGSFGATTFQSGEVQNNPFIFVNGFSAGSSQQFAVNSSGQVNIGSSGSSLSGINFGSCNILAYSNTIAATTTGQVDCSVNGGFSPLTGVSKGDAVIGIATTTLSTAYYGIDLVASAASSTPGYVTLFFDNLTGTTFTWSATASTSFKYIDVH